MTHKEATAAAAEMECLLCGDSPCEPCHYPTHRGMGGAKAGWDEDEWVPMCRFHHDALDKRNGVSDHSAHQSMMAQKAASDYQMWMRKVRS
jgi:hypothetical protein